MRTCAERGQCFSDEKPVCLFHIPLVPGATSEGRESAQTFLQDADVRIKSQADSCTQQGRKTEMKKRETVSEGEVRLGRGKKQQLSFPPQQLLEKLSKKKFNPLEGNQF